MKVWGARKFGGGYKVSSGNEKLKLRHGKLCCVVLCLFLPLSAFVLLLLLFFFFFWLVWFLHLSFLSYFLPLFELSSFIFPYFFLSFYHYSFLRLTFPALSTLLFIFLLFAISILCIFSLISVFFIFFPYFRKSLCVVLRDVNVLLHFSFSLILLVTILFFLFPFSLSFFWSYYSSGVSSRSCSFSFLLIPLSSSLPLH